MNLARVPKTPGSDQVVASTIDLPRTSNLNCMRWSIFAGQFFTSKGLPIDRHTSVVLEPKHHVYFVGVWSCHWAVQVGLLAFYRLNTRNGSWWSWAQWKEQALEKAECALWDCQLAHNHIHMKVLPLPQTMNRLSGADGGARTVKLFIRHSLAPHTLITARQKNGKLF